MHSSRQIGVRHAGLQDRMVVDVVPGQRLFDIVEIEGIVHGERIRALSASV
jgi:hypothetical protein